MISIILTIAGSGYSHAWCSVCRVMCVCACMCEGRGWSRIDVLVV